MTPEKPKAKPSLGFLLLIIGLTVYSFAVAAIADWIIDLPLFVQLIYFGVAGIVWIFPAKNILVWSLRGANSAHEDERPDQ